MIQGPTHSDRIAIDEDEASLSLSQLWSPQAAPADSARRDLIDILLADGDINAEQATTARSLQSKHAGKPAADVLIDMKVDEPAVQQAVARLNRLPFERVEANDVDHKYLGRLGAEFCLANGVLPLGNVGGRLLLGVTQPDHLIIVDEVRHKLGVAVKLVVVCRHDIATIVESLREAETQDIEIDQIIAGIDEDDVEVVESKKEEVDLERMAGESPVIRLVNYLIFNAVKEGASDIHIEPQERKLQVRYRIDGVLFETMTPPGHMQSAIISRLKIMANMDISERRLPQDGRIRAMVHGRKLDLRLSTLPTAHGEKAVLRILDTRAINVTLDELGMSEDALTIWQHHIDRPHGILLVTGPTGSGKTTTLYASIRQMNRQKLNISTVEDPVEYQLDGITQTQVHEKIGMAFCAALRALLRQDPDVIMIGEIRDVATATTAIQASLTGHLVLSTLHTNDAPSSITRLINIGVEPFLVGAALNATLAQRLTRRICSHCKRPVEPNEQLAEHLRMHGYDLDHVHEGAGCDRCRNTGYAGRVGLYEMLTLDDMLRDRIAGSPNVTEFRRLCVERGMVTLRTDGFAKAAAGLTTIQEVLRVTESTI
jgi:type IV pilus assembly protein PilB